jgi:hypothetical protein
MPTITVGIDSIPERGEGIHYVFTWTGNDEEAHTVISRVEEGAAKQGMNPADLARAALHHLADKISNIPDDMLEAYQSTILWYAFKLPIIGAGEGKTVLQRLALPEDILVSFRAQHHGDERGEVQGTARLRTPEEGAVVPLSGSHTRPSKQ